MNIEIKHRYTGATIFSVEAASFKIAVELAIKGGSDLSHSNLRRSDLSHSDLSGSNLIDAGQDRRGYRFVGVRQEVGYMIHAGCRWLSVESAKDHWNNTHARDQPLKTEILEKLKLIAATAKARGWNKKG